MKSRQQITDFIVSNIHAILPDGFNRDRTKEFLDNLSNDEFFEYIRKLGTEEERLSIIAPNGAKVKLDLENNLKVAKRLGVELFQRIWVESPSGKGRYLTPDKYMILKLPVRRQAQLLVKKISIPDDNKSVDNLTGQPAGKSKSSRMSYPEVQMLAALGLNETLREFMKYRGGDRKGFQVMNTLLHRNGRVSLDAIEPYSGKVRSTEVLSAYLTAMHLANNL